MILDEQDLKKLSQKVTSAFNPGFQFGAARAIKLNGDFFHGFYHRKGSQSLILMHGA